MQKGDYAYGKGDFHAAIAAYSEAIKLNPKIAGLYYNRSVAYWMQNEYKKVIADCSEAIRLDPKML